MNKLNKLFMITLMLLMIMSLVACGSASASLKGDYNVTYVEKEDAGVLEGLEAKMIFQDAVSLTEEKIVTKDGVEISYALKGSELNISTPEGEVVLAATISEDEGNSVLDFGTVKVVLEKL